jgi:hypothetical protein
LFLALIWLAGCAAPGVLKRPLGAPGMARSNDSAPTPAFATHAATAQDKPQ